MGVNIFFVLSGFVLYLPFAENPDRPTDLVGFFKKRGRRLLPLYYFNILVCLILFVGEPLARVVSHAILYLFALFPTPVLFFPPMNPPLWSLGLEIWFSILFPFLLILTRRLGPVLALAFLVAASVAFHGIGTAFFQVEWKYLNDVADTLPGRLSDFCIGMLAAHLWVREDRIERKSTGRLRAFLLAGAGLAYIGLILSLARFSGGLPPVAQTVANLSTAASTALFIVGLVRMESFPLLRRALENRALQVVGMMCFSIYIWHWQLLHVYNYLWGDQTWVQTPLVATYFLVLSAVSAASYRFIEFPHKDARSIFLLTEARGRAANRRAPGSE